MLCLFAFLLPLLSSSDEGSDSGSEGVPACLEDSRRALSNSWWGSSACGKVSLIDPLLVLEWDRISIGSSRVPARSLDWFRREDRSAAVKGLPRRVLSAIEGDRRTLEERERDRRTIEGQSKDDRRTIEG